jgi:agmatine/peptidylarginine deiminase
MKKNSHQPKENGVKHILVISLILLSFILSINNLVAQVEDDVPVWKKAHYLSEEEMLMKEWVDRDFYPTDPPEGPVYNVAEFAQMEGVLVRYPFGIPVSLIAEMSEDVMVTTIVLNASQETYVTNLYQSGGVNLNNCNFLHAPSDSYWTRDYGPWYVIDGNYDIGIVNFPYNRPRPSDNDIPIKMAEFLDVTLFGMNVIHTGGNYMTDGLGNSSSTTLVWDENPGVSHEEINQYLEDYLGITTYHVLPDPLGEYIEHIDCWGKFLDVNKVLIGQVPESDPRYDDFEYVADYFANQLSGWGMLYEVYRVFTPGTSPQTPYTNSLILNNKVLVPLTGSQWDDEAIATYEEAMPGYEILGIYSSGGPGWANTDALHCRTKGVADRGMLWVRHMPLWGNLSEQTDYIIEATIVPLSGAALYPDSVLVYYKVDEGSYASVQMTTQDDTTYIGLIPGAEPGSEIAYYIHAADESGKNANHPFIGAPDPHTFMVIENYDPNIYINPDEIETGCLSGNTTTETFTVYNTGNMDLEYTIDYSISVYEPFDYVVTDSPEGSTYNYNTFDELGWTEFTVEEEGIISGWQMSFTWSTTGFPNMGSFRAESPTGTVTQISGSLNNGSYTIAVDAFNEETMQGTWKIWIEDSFGDGGHQATDITITITRTYEPASWLSVNPLSGTITPGNNEEIEVVCDATLLEGGLYLGDIFVYSNDPDQPEITIPVSFNVEPLADVTVVPDSLVFLDHQQMWEGQPVMVYNLTDTEVTINYINPEGWETFYWFIDPWGITLPYDLPPGDSLELVVKIGIPVESMGVLLCDTLFIETSASTHKVAIKVDSDLVSIADPDHLASLNLTNYPNPFSGSTTIAFEVGEPSKVALDIFNYQGQLINTLLNEDLLQGLHYIIWNGTDYNGDAVSSGIYIYRLSIGKTVSIQKMLLMK